MSRMHWNSEVRKKAKFILIFLSFGHLIGIDRIKLGKKTPRFTITVKVLNNYTFLPVKQYLDK
jgi:hypothetical protein